MILHSPDDRSTAIPLEDLAGISPEKALREKIFGLGARVIGAELPVDELARFAEQKGPYFFIQNEPPLGASLSTLLRAYPDPNKELTRRINQVQEHADNWRGLSGWTAERKLGIWQSPSWENMGPEAYFIGKFGDDPTAIAKQLSAEAAELSKKEWCKNLFSRLNPGQFNELTLSDLDIVDEIIHDKLGDWRSTMTNSARAYNSDTSEAIGRVPKPMQKIFFAVVDGKLQQFYVVPQLEIVPALRAPDLSQLSENDRIIRSKFGRLLRGVHPYARTYMKYSITPTV